MNSADDIQPPEPEENKPEAEEKDKQEEEQNKKAGPPKPKPKSNDKKDDDKDLFMKLIEALFGKKSKEQSEQMQNQFEQMMQQMNDAFTSMNKKFDDQSAKMNEKLEQNAQEIKGLKDQITGLNEQLAQAKQAPAQTNQAPQPEPAKQEPEAQANQNAQQPSQSNNTLTSVFVTTGSGKNQQVKEFKTDKSPEEIAEAFKEDVARTNDPEDKSLDNNKTEFSNTKNDKCSMNADGKSLSLNFNNSDDANAFIQANGLKTDEELNASQTNTTESAPEEAPSLDTPSPG